METNQISERSRGVALILGSALGVFGAHRFYTGKIATGILQLGTLGGLGVWWLYDMILLLSGSFRDVDEKRVWTWWEPGPGQAFPAASSEQMEAILFELDAMRSEMGELNERVDFVERVLARAKDREALPGH